MAGVTLPLFIVNSLREHILGWIFPFGGFALLLFPFLSITKGEGSSTSRGRWLLGFTEGSCEHQGMEK